MAEKTKYDLAEDSEGGFHILKQDRFRYKEMAVAPLMRDATLIVAALNEKEERDRVARDAALHDSVEDEAEAADPLQPHSIDPEDKRPVFFVGDK
jgi:hypothetical protein